MTHEQGGEVLVNGFGGHVGGLREFQETEERWACSARYGGNTGLKCNLEMRLIAVKEAAHQILHVDVFGSSNRVKKNKKKTGQGHRGNLQITTCRSVDEGSKSSKYCDIGKWTCFQVRPCCIQAVLRPLARTGSNNLSSITESMQS